MVLEQLFPRPITYVPDIRNIDVLADRLTMGMARVLCTRAPSIRTVWDPD
jgi:hypothetical protein